MVVVINTKQWYRARDILNVQKPSGIFIYEGKGAVSPLIKRDN
jgi:hypothetical protein